MNAVDVVQPPRSSNQTTAVALWPVSVTADRGLSESATLRPPRFMICSPIAGTSMQLSAVALHRRQVVVADLGHRRVVGAIRRLAGLRIEPVVEDHPVPVRERPRADRRVPGARDGVQVGVGRLGEPRAVAHQPREAGRVVRRVPLQVIDPHLIDDQDHHQLRWRARSARHAGRRRRDPHRQRARRDDCQSAGVGGGSRIAGQRYRVMGHRLRIGR